MSDIYCFSWKLRLCEIQMKENMIIDDEEEDKLWQNH